jgi:hypothetical protein
MKNLNRFSALALVLLCLALTQPIKEQALTSLTA